MIHILELKERIVPTFPGAGLLHLAKLRSVFRPWVARITGPDERFGLAREFIEPRRDYREASNSGRGVILVFALRPGIHEVKEITSGRYFERRFVTVTPDGKIRATTSLELFELTGVHGANIAPTKMRNGWTR